MKLLPGYYHFISSNPKFTGEEEYDYFAIVYPNGRCECSHTFNFEYWREHPTSRLRTDDGDFYICRLGDL